MLKSQMQESTEWQAHTYAWCRVCLAVQQGCRAALLRLPEGDQHNGKALDGRQLDYCPQLPICIQYVARFLWALDIPFNCNATVRIELPN